MSEQNSQPSRIIINTVGISALLNLRTAKRENRLPATYDLDGLEALLKMATNEENTARAVQALLAMMQQPDYTDPSLRLVAAEISSLNILITQKTDRLYFLAGAGKVSITDQGVICAYALEKYFVDQVADVKIRIAQEFTVDQQSETIPQPENFLKELDIVVKAEQTSKRDVPILINATGGYKLGGIYAALVGLKYGCEVYYLHEQMRVPVGLPAITVEQLAKLNEGEEHERRFLSQAEFDKLEKEVQPLYLLTLQGYQLRSLVDVVTGFPEPVWQTPYQRRKKLEKNIEDIIQLINEYERKEMLADDPIERMRCRENVGRLEDQKTKLEKKLNKLI